MAGTLSRWGPTGRIRLVLGALFLVAVATGVWGVWQFSRLGPAIDVVMRENYRSVRAMQALKEALERLDSGAIFAVDGQEAEGRRLFARNDPAVREALAAELGNLTLSGERQRAEALQGLYGVYRETLTGLLEPGRSLEERRRAYFDELLPTFQTIKDEANAILEMNQRSMEEANERARSRAGTAELVMVFLVFVAGYLVFYLASLLRTWFFEPLESLRESMERVGPDDLDHRVEIDREDEVGRLAAAYDAMLSRLRAGGAEAR